MITSQLFDRVKYHSMRYNAVQESIDSIIGLDTEAYDNGEPFIVCLSDKSIFSPSTFARDILKKEKYHCRHFGVWNLKYDAGAVFYFMPIGAIIYNDKNEIIRFVAGKKELWVTNKTTWRIGDDTVTVEYIPHKYVKLSLGRDVWVKIWDIFQFFGTSLDKAGKKYLGEGKKDIETKSFSREYVKKNYRKICEYCISDCKLVSRLGNFFLEKLSEFGIRATALYSSASLSFRYFQDRTDIIDVRRYWKHYKDLLKVAIDSYEGGKFDLIARGAFKQGYEYDIVSAYPYEISRLLDIRFCKVKRSRRYQKFASYGFLRCKVSIYKSVHVPFGLIIDNTRIYPIGRYYVTMTKQEYDYVRGELDIKPVILDAFWLFCEYESYPYKEVIDQLFDIKNRMKGIDESFYMLSKIMMNGFYGKMAQMIPDWKGNIQAGIGWNPIYASIITANTRIRVTRLQNQLKEKCLIVHTDSIITTEKLPDSMLSQDLGALTFEVSGPGIIIACGCYQIGDRAAFKGFEPRKNREGEYDSWDTLLRRNRTREKIPYTQLRVESWTEATSKGHFDVINKFQEMPKDIDLNVEIKRVWDKPVMKGEDFLDGLHYSKPRIVVHHSIPSYWKG